MASINQLVSEIAHSVGGANNVPVLRAIRLSIIHSRNQLIRHSYEQHGYTDKVLRQRFRVSLVDVPDGDINGAANLGVAIIKRTKQRVPRPVRFTDGIPFKSVHTSGFKTCLSIPFVSEPSAKYYENLPGFCNLLTYDYQNGFIYIMIGDNTEYSNLGSIIIDSVFEKPEEIVTNNNNGIDYTTSDNKQLAISDDDEYLIPEDMINDLKKLVLETYQINIARETNEVQSKDLVK